MDFIHEVLKKTHEEGKIDARLLPWLESKALPDETEKNELFEHGTSSKNSQVADKILDDIKRFVENIRSMAAANALQVIGFTSAVPNEGTSTILSTASQMAAGQQQKASPKKDGTNGQKANKRRNQGILTIDAQFRHPSLHKIIGASQQIGLIDFLNRNISAGDVIGHTSNANLKLICAGETSWDPSVQLNVEKFAALLERTKQQFEFIFIDIPQPLLYAEGVVISRLCQGVVFVVRAGQTKWEVVKEAMHILESAGVNILGGVLNRIDPIPDRIQRSL